MTPYKKQPIGVASALINRGATHCIITKEYLGFVRFVRCHVNGEPDRAGATLYCYYNTDLRIDQLLTEGDLIDLGSDIGQKRSIKNQQLDVSDDCLFRGRDAGEADCGARIGDSLEDVFRAFKEYRAKYLYVWRKGEWLTSSYPQLHWLEKLSEKLPSNIRN